jgi:hypothetical protein
MRVVMGFAIALSYPTLAHFMGFKCNRRVIQPSLRILGFAVGWGEERTPTLYINPATKAQE